MTTKFFTTEEVEDDIGLRQRAAIKLHAFHTALGEDSQIYSPDEEVGTFGLFDRQVGEKQEANERLQYPFSHPYQRNAWLEMLETLLPTNQFTIPLSCENEDVAEFNHLGIISLGGGK